MSRKRTEKPNRYKVEAVDRALLLLETIASLPGANPSQLATALGANRSLVFRMLTTLADRAFVTKDAHNGYRLGPRLLYLGHEAAASNSLIDASRDVLDRLVLETQENVYLITREGTEMLVLAQRISPKPIRLAGDVGTTGGLHSGGSAKVLLAHAPPDVIAHVIKEHLHEFVPRTARTQKAVEGILEKIRREGFYEGIGEINDETYTLSVPVRTGQDSIIAVLTVAGPISRITTGKRRELRLRTLAAAAEIAVHMSGRARELGSMPAQKRSGT